MKRRNLLILIGLAIVVLIAVFIVYFMKHKEADNVVEPNGIVELDTIEGYGYSLEDRDTELYKSKFKELRELLSKEEIDYEGYARLISVLYILDLYTISNKLNQYDVGGKEFVPEDYRENYELKVRDTLYKYVEDNTYGKRKQQLPEVISINVEAISEKEQTVNEEAKNGYEVKLTWEYVDDLGYDKSATVNVAEIDNKLYVVSQVVLEE